MALSEQGIIHAVCVRVCDHIQVGISSPLPPAPPSAWSCFRRREKEWRRTAPPFASLLPLPALLLARPLGLGRSVGRVGVGAELQRLEEEEEGILFPTDRSLFRVQKSREGEKQREGSNNTTKCPIA